MKGALDTVIRKHGLKAGEVYNLFCDGFSDLEFTLRGELDIDPSPYRQQRPAVREWDDAVTSHQAEARKAIGHAARIAAEQRGAWSRG